jgi:hypothetical protein
MRGKILGGKANDLNDYPYFRHQLRARQSSGGNAGFHSTENSEEPCSITQKVLEKI